MIYEIVYSNEAKLDLRDIFEYIANELLEPEIASNQVKRIIKAIYSLEQMPLRYKLYEEEPWHSQGLRVLPVDNYLVFYMSNKENSIGNIVRIMYQGRDIKKQLDD